MSEWGGGHICLLSRLLRLHALERRRPVPREVDVLAAHIE